MAKSSLAASKRASQGLMEETKQGTEKADALIKEPMTMPDSGNSTVQGAKLSPELARTWLEWQCRMVAGIVCGVLYEPVEIVNKDAAIAIWPEANIAGQQLQLIDAAAEALQEKRGVTRSLKRYGPDNQRACDVISCPLYVDKVPVAVVSVMISPRSETQQQAVLQLLQWGGLWMDTLVRQQLFAQQEAHSMTAMTAIFHHASDHAAAMETVKQLAEQFNCERVSIGFRKDFSIRLQALSHVASFDPRSQLIRRIEAAMEEAVDQQAAIIYPDLPNQLSTVSRAHNELAVERGASTIFTIPLQGVAGNIIGAITLERCNGLAFDKKTRQLCESLTKLIGPALELKQHVQKGLWTQGLNTLRTAAKKLLGREYLRLKLATLSVALLLTALSLIDGRHEITAPASIEGAVRQTLVAPYNGYIKTAEVRAGDLVEKDQLIASLDDQYLQLERQKWLSERGKIEKEYRQALAQRERSELRVFGAQLDQVDAEIKLVDAKIQRALLHAPFAGVVVNGDLSQSLGAPVDIGQVLYEVAPLDSYRVVLEVDEHDVAGLESGKVGRLIISALPQKTFQLNVDRVVPVAVSSDKRNFFRVEASLDQPVSVLRPGMRGVAKVELGQRSLLWIWTHAVFDRISLWAWSVGW